MRARETQLSAILWSSRRGDFTVAIACVPCGPRRSLIYAWAWGFWGCWKLSAAEQIKPDCCHTPAVVSILLTPLPVSCPLTTVPSHYYYYYHQYELDAVLGNRYFSACDWRFISCQFAADVKENPGGFQSQLNIDSFTLSQTVVTDSILFTHGRDLRGCRKFELCT